VLSCKRRQLDVLKLRLRLRNVRNNGVRRRSVAKRSPKMFGGVGRLSRHGVQLPHLQGLKALDPLFLPLLLHPQVNTDLVHLKGNVKWWEDLALHLLGLLLLSPLYPVILHHLNPKRMTMDSKLSRRRRYGNLRDFRARHRCMCPCMSHCFLPDIICIYTIYYHTSECVDCSEYTCNVGLCPLPVMCTIT